MGKFHTYIWLTEYKELKAKISVSGVEKDLENLEL